MTSVDMCSTASAMTASVMESGRRKGKSSGTWGNHWRYRRSCFFLMDCIAGHRFSGGTMQTAAKTVELAGVGEEPALICRLTRDDVLSEAFRTGRTLEYSLCDESERSPKDLVGHLSHIATVCMGRSPRPRINICK